MGITLLALSHLLIVLDDIEMFAFLQLLLIFIYARLSNPNPTAKTVLITTCFSTNDVHYIDDWLEYHIFLGFDSIIVVDKTVDSVFEEYVGMYSPHLKVVLTREYESTVSLSSTLDTMLRTEYWALQLDVTEFLVLSRFDSITSYVSSINGDSTELDRVLFGSSNHEKIDATNVDPYSLIARFTARSNRISENRTKLLLLSQLPSTDDVRRMFRGSQIEISTVTTSSPFIASFACRSTEEFLHSILELTNRLHDCDDGCMGMLEQFSDILSPEQLESAVSLVTSQPESTWLSEIHKLIRHLDVNSVPDYSLLTTQLQYSGKDYHHPTQWLNLIYNQPQSFLGDVEFRVEYEHIEVCDYIYHMNVGHLVDVFQMQPDNVHRVPSVQSSEALDLQQEGDSRLLTSNVDNNSVYCTLMHLLLGMYPRMRVNQNQLDVLMKGFLGALAGSTDHLDVEEVKAAMLQDFTSYYQRSVLTYDERIRDYYHEKRHNESEGTCFSSYPGVLSQTEAVQRKNFLMLVIHHDHQSLQNIHNHLDLRRLDYVIPVRIDSSVFFEYTVYRDFLPDVLPDLESYEYVLVTTHSTLTNIQPTVCGYEVARLLAVAFQYDYDVVPLIRTKDMLLPSVIAMHTINFKRAWDALLKAMGYSWSRIREFDFVSPFYRNSFIIKPERLRELTFLMRRAISIAENHPEVRELLSRPMGFMYVGTSSTSLEESQRVAMSVFNTTYYQLFPFVFERLPVFFLLSQGASVCQHNEDCYTPQPDPVRPLSTGEWS